MRLSTTASVSHAQLPHTVADVQWVTTDSLPAGCLRLFQYGRPFHEPSEYFCLRLPLSSRLGLNCLQEDNV